MDEENPTASSVTGRTERTREESAIRSSRRRLLSGLAAGFSLLAGCSALTGDSSTTAASPGSQSSTATERAAETETQTAIPTEATTPNSTPTPLPTETSTQTETAMTTPVSTRTPVGTATPAVTATPAGTASSTPMRDVVLIAPDDLTTYTNTRIGYSIKYPSEWATSVRSLDTPSWVAIKPSSSAYSAYTDINIYGYSDLPFSPSTLDAFATWFEELFQGVYDELTVERRQAVTLPNGNRARVLSVLARRSESPNLRLTWLFTIVNGTGYSVQVRLLDKAYTPTVERTVNEIIESFTIGTDSTEALAPLANVRY